jgi:hypothetical protein
LSEKLGGGTLLGSFDNRDVLETASKLARVQYFTVVQANETMIEANPKRDSHLHHPFRPGTEVRYLRDEMRRVGRLADAGSLVEAREACAALMFDFQVIIVGRPHLGWQFAELLGRCGATGLSRRFQIAAGIGNIGAPRPAQRVAYPWQPQSVTAGSSQTSVLISEVTSD